jgi:hypothetical protein
MDLVASAEAAAAAAAAAEYRRANTEDHMRSGAVARRLRD